MSAIDWNGAAPAAPYEADKVLKTTARRAGFGVALVMATGTAYACIALAVLFASGILGM